MVKLSKFEGPTSHFRPELEHRIAELLLYLSNQWLDTLNVSRHCYDFLNLFHCWTMIKFHSETWSESQYITLLTIFIPNNRDWRNGCINIWIVANWCIKYKLVTKKTDRKRHKKGLSWQCPRWKKAITRSFNILATTPNFSLAHRDTYACQIGHLGCFYAIPPILLRFLSYISISLRVSFPYVCPMLFFTLLYVYGAYINFVGEEKVLIDYVTICRRHLMKLYESCAKYHNVYLAVLISSHSKQYPEITQN